jgi:hypothetical protein
MTLLVPSNRNPSKKPLYRDPKLTSEEVETRTTKISRAWTSVQRSERKRLGTEKRDWLFWLLDRSS